MKLLFRQARLSRVACSALGLVCAAFAIAGAAVKAEAPEFYLEVKPQKTEVHVGDLVDVYLRWKDPAFNPDRIERVTSDVDHDQWEPAADWRRDWQTQQKEQPGPWHAALRPFAVGEVTLPTTHVNYRAADHVSTQTTLTSTTLAVQSVLPPNAKPEELIGLRGPAPIPRDWSWVWILLSVLTLGGLAAWFMYRIWLRRQALPIEEKPAEPPLPPGLWALRELDRRSHLPVCSTGPAKAVFTLVSEVVRLYIERRWGINALDMTTLECLRVLHARQIGNEPLRWIKAFLDECDFVKFTRHEPPRERWATIWNDARLIVQITTPAEELDPDGVPVSQPEEVAV